MLSKNYVTKAVRQLSSLLLLFSLNRRKEKERERERVNLVLTWYDGHHLFVVFSRSILCFFCKLLLNSIA